MRVAKSPIGDPQWCEFVASQPDASPFHLPAWAQLIADCYRFETFALVVRDADGEVLAGVPIVAVRSPIGRLRWVSLPYSDSCPALVRPGVATGDVVSALRQHAQSTGVRDLELRANLGAAHGIHPVEVGYNYVLALPSDPSELHPSKGHRQHRNKAARGGVEVVRGSSKDDLSAFYRLHTLTRRRQGVPVQPRRFFELIGERMIEPGHGFVATASLDGDIVAANLYLHHNGTLTAKYRASDPAKQDTGAGFLVDWEMIAAACAEGYHTLDLGRTDFDAEGQRRYKAGWGAVEETLVYTHISAQEPSSRQLHAGGLSRRVVRASPTWVCRALGEVLYRWTA